MPHLRPTLHSVQLAQLLLAPESPCTYFIVLQCVEAKEVGML